MDFKVDTQVLCFDNTPVIRIEVSGEAVEIINTLKNILTTKIHGGVNNMEVYGSEYVHNLIDMHDNVTDTIKEYRKAESLILQGNDLECNLDESGEKYIIRVKED